MAIIKEWACAAHGEFEGAEGICPWGCSSRFVRQEIRTAPAYHDGRTKRVDRELEALARDYGMTDIRSDKDSGSVMQQMQKTKPEELQPFWKEVPHNQPGWTKRGEAQTKYGASDLGLQGDAVLQQVKEAAVQNNVGDRMQGPKLETSQKYGLVAGRATLEECQ